MVGVQINNQMNELKPKEREYQTMKNTHDSRMLKVKVITITALGIAALALSACNTVSGVGKDLQESSKNVKQAIEN